MGRIYFTMQPQKAFFFFGVNRKNMLVDMAEIFIPDGSYSKIMLIKESTWPLKSALIIYYLLSLL